MEFIDFHAHLHPTTEARASLLKKMDEVGIHRAIVVAGGVVPPLTLSQQMKVTEGGDFPVPNRRVAELCSETGNRLLPFYFANPRSGAAEYRNLAYSYYGLKLGPAVHGVSLLDPMLDEFFGVAELNEHPVYLHCLSKPGFDVSSLVNLAKRYPLIQFVLGHAGIGQCDFEAVRLIRDQKNILFETSGGFSSVIASAVQLLGIERILFGTEYPLQAPEVELRKMECLKLDAVTLNRNVSRVLGNRYVW